MTMVGVDNSSLHADVRLCIRLAVSESPQQRSSVII